MFYPGTSIGIKRIVHTLILSGLSLNIIFQDIEDKIIKSVSQSVLQLEELLPEIENAELVLSPIVSSIEKIEDSQFKWAIDYFKLPTSGDLNSKKETLIELKRSCTIYNDIFVKFAWLLSWIGWCFMITIILSSIWMYLDLTKGKNKLATLFCLTIAVLINYKIYGFATGYVDQFLHI